MIPTLLRLLPAGRRSAVGAYLVLAVLGVVSRAVGAVLLVPLVAALFGSVPGDAWPWLGALAVVTAVGWVVDALAARIGFGLGFALLDHAQHRVADSISRIRLAWFTAEHTATARQAIAATGPDLVGLVIYLVTPLLGAILLPIAIGVALLPVSWPLGVAALAGVPVLLGAFWAAGRIGRRADRAAAEANGALAERIVEFARTQEPLRAARRVEPARSHAGAALATQHRAMLRLLLMQVPGQLLFSLASQLALILLAGTATVLGIRGQISAPEVIALVVVIARYLEPFTALGELAPGFEATTTTLRRLCAVLAAPVVPAGTTSSPMGTDAARIELKGVGFRYRDDGEAVLDGLDLTLEAGSTTAIVGPSGSGKSTILALLAGLYEPTAGRVLVDGVDTAELDADSRRALVSVVFQHPYLFAGSVRDNILAGHAGAGADEFERALALARVDELTGRLPDGDASEVGEGGVALSGGERQRVSIARAVVKRAPVLLVDEATSALDTENEHAIVQALTGDPVARTRVIVAHRLSSIRHADRVVFLDRGRIVEDGSVETLLAEGGRFAEFWARQEGAAGWQITAGDA